MNTELAEIQPAEKVALAARELEADLIITASHHPSFLGPLFGLDQAPQIMQARSSFTATSKKVTSQNCAFMSVFQAV